MDAHTVNVLSLCAGVAGLDIGFRIAVPTARTVCMVEGEAFACAILATRMQAGALDECPVWSDCRTFDGRPWRGAVDFVIAGIPCQGNSIAGKRQLEADPRNLWPDTRRVLRETGAWGFFLENVPGILIPNRGTGQAAPIVRILAELAEDGWDAEWGVFSASQVGASHQRKRVFLLAYRRDARRQKRTGERRNDGQERAAAERDRGALADSQSDDGGTIERRHREQATIETGAESWIERSSEDVRDPASEGRQRGICEPHEIRFGPFAPGPIDPRWAGIIADAPHLAPAVKPRVHLLADGDAVFYVDERRAHQLRAIGNAVVPLCAAVAFTILDRRFDE